MFKADCLYQVNIMYHVSLQNVWSVQLGSPSHDCEMQHFAVSETTGTDVSAWTRAGCKWWIGITAFTDLVQFYLFPGPLAQKTNLAARLYEAPAFTYPGLALSLHPSPHGLKTLALIFLTAKCSDDQHPLLSYFQHIQVNTYSALQPFQGKLSSPLPPSLALEFMALENDIYKPTMVWDIHIFTPPCTHTEGSLYPY